MVTSRAIRWLLSAARDNRGVTLVELLTVILLFSVLLGGVTGIVAMGQNIVRDTVVYSTQENQFMNLASIIVNEGLNSSGITQTGDNYAFDNNPKDVIVKYSATEQVLALWHDQTEMMKIDNIVSFQLNPDPIQPKMYEMIIEGLNPYGEPVTLTNHWSVRR